MNAQLRKKYLQTNSFPSEEDQDMSENPKETYRWKINDLRKFLWKSGKSRRLRSWRIRLVIYKLGFNILLKLLAADKVINNFI